ncbi:MAG: hypothetical protein LBC40_03615 [Dysgonamonadaceae bacterium]|jgi:hypothetical protein|nr:hypothetical protein [Dysgonamonadaceae bacterium]
MKLKFFSCIAASVLFCAGISAQVFIIERGSTSLSYPNIKAAVDALQDNDQLYLPPGEHSLKGYTWEGYEGTGNYSNILVVNKKVSIYGGGCANGANSTVLKDGTFVIGKDAGGSLITGIRFDGDFRLDNVSNCIVSRCLTTGSFDLYGAGDNNVITECEFKNSVYGNSSGYITNFGNGLSCIFSKCIFSSNINRLRASEVYNCIFTYVGSSTPISPSSTCTFNNNIFIGSKTLTNQKISVTATGSTFSNNMWIGGEPSVSATDNNTLNNNQITKELYANVFVDVDAGDYHLKDECKGKNAGTDGTDVGIYGTSVPFKENRLPLIPNFSLKAISPETNSAGKLPVNIVIDAQER